MPRKNLSKLNDMLTSKKAPLVETDINELGDKRLNVEEGVIRKRQECLDLASRHRIGGQAELEDPERASGARLGFSELLTKLRRICPELQVLDGSPGSVALYCPRDRKEFDEALQEWEHGSKDRFFLHYKYAGGFPKKETSEYSTIDIDTSLLPTRENRGWRTVLISLLKQGVISYADAVQEFGDVGMDKRGWRWNEQTRAWRARPYEKFRQSEFAQGE